MKNNGSVDNSPQGAELFPDQIPSVDQVSERLKRDLAMLGNLVDAIRTDAETLKSLSIYMHGSFANHIQKLKAEKDLKVKP